MRTLNKITLERMEGVYKKILYGKGHFSEL